MVRVSSLLSPLLLVSLLAGLSGCTSVTRVFPDRPAEQVWTAMLVAAEQPDYTSGPPESRWHVRENLVHVDDAERRLEIYRELDRYLVRGDAPPIRERSQWRIRIDLEEGSPPRATFTNRGLAVHMNAVSEAERYFADVEALLENGAADAATN